MEFAPPARPRCSSCRESLAKAFTGTGVGADDAPAAGAAGAAERALPAAPRAAGRPAEVLLQRWRRLMVLLGAGLRVAAGGRRACSVPTQRLLLQRPAAARALPAVVAQQRRWLAGAPSPNPRVYLDVAIGAAEPQRITFEVRVPVRTCCCSRCPGARTRVSLAVRRQWRALASAASLSPGRPLTTCTRPPEPQLFAQTVPETAGAYSLGSLAGRLARWLCIAAAQSNRLSCVHRRRRRELPGALHRGDGHARRDRRSVTF